MKIFEVGDNKVVAYCYYNGDCSVHKMNVYEKRKFLFIPIWRAIFKQKGYASPSNSYNYKGYVLDYFGETYSSLIEKYEKKKERKRKIKKLLS